MQLLLTRLYAAGGQWVKTLQKNTMPKLGPGQHVTHPWTLEYILSEPTKG